MHLRVFNPSPIDAEPIERPGVDMTGEQQFSLHFYAKRRTTYGPVFTVCTSNNEVISKAVLKISSAGVMSLEPLEEIDPEADVGSKAENTQS